MSINLLEYEQYVKCMLLYFDEYCMYERYLILLLPGLTSNYRKITYEELFFFKFLNINLR